jgi:hypothetical protein
MSQSRGGGDAEPGSETLPRGGQAEAHSRRRALEAFNGRWVLSESHGLDGFLQTMGMGFVGRSLAAAIPLANEIRFEQTAGKLSPPPSVRVSSPPVSGTNSDQLRPTCPGCRRRQHRNSDTTSALDSTAHLVGFCYPPPRTLRCRCLRRPMWGLPLSISLTRVGGMCTDTSVMHVELQAPGRRFIYEHRLGGGGYEYRRPDNGHMEIANTVWDGDRLVTITQPSQPLVGFALPLVSPTCHCCVPVTPFSASRTQRSVRGTQVLPMRSERWLDSRNNMVIAHRICPTAPALLHFAMNPSPEACVSMRRIYRRCVQPPSALPSLPALSIPLAAVLPNVPKAAAEAAQR